MEASGYNLYWETFSNHLAEISRELYDQKQFSDVTLVSDDMTQIKAHRVILSACSPVFRSLLMMNPNLQSQLYMKGVKGTELDSIIKFIYFGEVQVPASGIMKFLKAGNELEITELKKVMPVTGKTDQASHYKSVKTESVADTFDLEDHSNENREIAPTDDGEPTEEKVSNMKRHEVSPLKDSEQTEEDDAIVKRIREDGLLECPLQGCLATYTHKNNVVRHYRSVHQGVRYPCDECGRLYTEIGAAFKIHKIRHAGIWNPCGVCKKNYDMKEFLKIHKMECHKDELPVTNV